MAFDASSFWSGWSNIGHRSKAFLKVTTKEGDQSTGISNDPQGVGYAQVVALTSGVADTGPLGTASNPNQTQAVAAAAGVTPAALEAKKIAVAGTAVTVITGPVDGGFVQNPATAALQGIGSAETLYIDMVAAPGSTDAASVTAGTTEALSPGQTFTVPPLAAGSSVRVNAATINHAFAGSKW